MASGGSVPIRDFIAGIPADELVRHGVLQRHQRFGFLLQGASVQPLLELMRRREVARLFHGPQWEIHADGRFRNSWAQYPELTRFESCTTPGDVFREANARINPHYRVSSGSPTTMRSPMVTPGAGTLVTFEVTEPIFTSEDISKPENRCNLAIFHLLGFAPFHEWFTRRLQLPASTVFYPRENQLGTRPDLVAHDPAGELLGVIEVELGGADAGQMANYTSKYSAVFLITGAPAPGSHLSLEEIRSFFIGALPDIASSQQALSAKYLIRLIADTVGGDTNSSKRAPVSTETLGHPFIARLVALLADCAPLPGAKGPTPGRLYWDTAKAEGFSLKAYSIRGADKHISLLARSGGRETVIFQAEEKYLSYLQHKGPEARRWCDYISKTIGVPIDSLEVNRRLEIPMATVEPHLEELAALIRRLA